MLYMMMVFSTSGSDRKWVIQTGSSFLKMERDMFYYRFRFYVQKHETFVPNIFSKNVNFDLEMTVLMTNLVYRERPTTRDNMIHIRDTILSLDTDEILRATNDFEKRTLACIEANGAHFEHQT